MTAVTMKAIKVSKYGAPEVLEVHQVTKPIPQKDEVLIKIMATPVTAADTMMRQGTPKWGRLILGLQRPKKPIPGTGFAGTVEAVGSAVSQFRVGDAVFGETAFDFSANAEYVCVAETGVIAHKPDTVSFAEAATVCDGAMTSLNFLSHLTKVQPGQQVLINGASGSLGTMAVQLAKHYGARVTGVCSGKNRDLVLSLGADTVIDYTKTDFTKASKKYDIVYDTIGKSSFGACKNILTENGEYLSPVLSMSLLSQMLWTFLFGKKKAKFAATGARPIPELRQMLLELKVMLENQVLTFVMDRTYPLEKVIDAHRYVDSGRKRGNVVLLPSVR